MALDSNWIFADGSLWVGESSLVISLSDWIISIEPFGPFVTLFVALKVIISWAAPSDLEVGTVGSVLLVEAPETDLDIDVSVGSGTSTSGESLDGSWVRADLEFGLRLNSFPITSSGKWRIFVHPWSPFVALEHAVIIAVGRVSPFRAAPLDLKVRASIELVVQANESFRDRDSFHLVG